MKTMLTFVNDEDGRLTPLVRSAEEIKAVLPEEPWTDAKKAAFTKAIDAAIAMIVKNAPVADGQVAASR